jgi:anti-anti-sigma factor
VLESRDEDGVLRIALQGQLDLVRADELSLHMRQLRRERRRVRLDLSGLDFIDSSGIRMLVVAVRDGRWQGDRLLEVTPEVRPNVQRVIEMLGLGPFLWPMSRSTRSPQPHADVRGSR